MTEKYIGGGFGGGGGGYTPPPPPPPPPPLPVLPPLPPLPDLPAPYQPNITPNNLFNDSYIDVLELIGEGEIEGLATRVPNFTGTYTQSAKTITVTHSSAVPLIPKTAGTFTFTGGASADNGARVIDSVISATQFTVLSNTSRTVTSSAVTVTNIIGMDSIYFDKLPLVQRDGTSTFSDVTVQLATGTQAQQPLANFPDIDQQFDVNEPLERAVNGGVKLIPILDNTIDFVKVSVGVYALQQLTEMGDVYGSSVNFRIEYSVNSSSGSPTYTIAVPETQTRISGRTSQPFQKQFGFALPANVNGRTIRITRLTADSTDPDRLQNRTFIASYNLIINAKLSYPNTALIGMRLYARQFTSIPQRSYWIKGLKVLIPDNATVDYRNGRVTYTGVWTGNFAAATWCADPAWCLYDLLVTKRYGTGDHLSSTQLDKWAFYSASQYCNELVSDGKGSTEPRFLLNININSAQDAFTAINSLLSVFRAIGYWSTGSLTIAQDRPVQPSYHYTAANVIDGNFNYSGSSVKARSTTVVVEWFDTETREMGYEYVEDADGIAKYGLIPRDVKGVGCQSQGQANRLGKWLMFSERYETDVVNFEVGIDSGMVCRPGAVIRVSDPTRAGVRLGGRIASVNGTTVVIDSPVTINVSLGVTIYCLLPTGQSEGRAIIAVGNSGGNVNLTGDTLLIQSAFTSTPQPGSAFVIDSGALQTQLFRVVSVTETQNGTFQVSALTHYPDKWANIETGLALQPRVISELNQPPATPTNLSVTQALYEERNQAKVKILVSWTPSARSVRFLIAYKHTEFGTWIQHESEVASFEINDAQAGQYTVRVTPVSAINLRGRFAETTVLLEGLLAPPGQVQNFGAAQVSKTVMRLTWDATTDIDVRIGGNIEILHTPALSSQSYQVGNLLAFLPGSAVTVDVPAMTGTYMAKFVDSSRVRSVTPSFISTNVPNLFEFNVVATSTQHAAFSGAISQSAAFTGTYTGGAATVNRDSGSTTATVTTATNHGLVDGDGIRLDIDSIQVNYPITFVDNKSFTVTTAATTALSAVSVTVYSMTLTDDLARASSGLTLSGYGDWDSILDVDNYINIDNRYGVKAAGTYTYSTVNDFNDLGAAYSNCEVRTSLTTLGYLTNSNIDEWPVLVDESVVPSIENILNWDGGDTFEANVFPYRRESSDNSTFTEWIPGYRNVTSLRYQECKLEFRSTNLFHNVYCSAATTTIDVPEYQLTGNNLTSGTVTFSPAFHSDPFIAITMENGASGDYYIITRTVVSGRTTGFTIVFYNSSNNVVTRTFDYLARGY